MHKSTVFSLITFHIITIFRRSLKKNSNYNIIFIALCILQAVTKSWIILLDYPVCRNRIFAASNRINESA